MAVFKSLFKIYGGASMALPEILKYIADMARSNDSTVFVDAFGGGAHVVENVEGYIDKNGVWKNFDKRIYNDSDAGFNALIKICSNAERAEKLYKTIEERFSTDGSADGFADGFEKQDWKTYNRTHNNIEICGSDEEMAIRTLVAKEFSFSGGNMPASGLKDKYYVKNHLDRLSKVMQHADALKNVQTHCEDAFDLIKNKEYWGKDSILFLDPPWLPEDRGSSSTKEYTCEMPKTRKDAEKLRAHDEEVYNNRMKRATERNKDTSGITKPLGMFYHSHEELRDLLLNSEMHGVIMIGYDGHEKTKDGSVRGFYDDLMEKGGFVRYGLNDVDNQTHDESKVEYLWYKE